MEVENDAYLHCLPRNILEVASAIRAIRLSHCPIRYLGTLQEEEEQGALKSLTMSPFYHLAELRVTHGKLLSLPTGCEHLPVLKVIDISYNALKELPELLGEAPALEALYASNNLLCKPLPPSLLGAKKLKVLDLHNNDLEPGHIPSPDGELPLLALKTLILDAQVVQHGLPPFPLRKGGILKKPGNMIVHPTTEHKSTFTRQSQTSSFDLVPPRYNRVIRFDPTTTLIHDKTFDPTTDTYQEHFTYVPTEFAVHSSDHLKHLPNSLLHKVCQVIIQDDKDSMHILPIIQRMSNMQTLILKNCKLSELPEDFFARMTSLKYVNLSKNHLIKIPDSFENISSLRTAIFDDNYITCFPSVPKNLLALRLNRNCIGLGDEPLSLLQLQFARSLEQLELAHNCMSPENFFPGNTGYPTQLKLKVFVIDQRTVEGPEGTCKSTFYMQDGCTPTYIKTADHAWQANVRKKMPIFARTDRGKQKLGIEQ
ncbi:MAG: leucine-rich repeat domain-containing protein [Anaplasmataceae bacterium]|nr:leucine-rich repeat domain-containing protein [Anaplasmataceae bacterium]